MHFKDLQVFCCMLYLKYFVKNALQVLFYIVVSTGTRYKSRYKKSVAASTNIKGVLETESQPEILSF